MTHRVAHNPYGFKAISPQETSISPSLCSIQQQPLTSKSGRIKSRGVVVNYECEKEHTSSIDYHQNGCVIAHSHGSSATSVKESQDSNSLPVTPEVHPISASYHNQVQTNPSGHHVGWSNGSYELNSAYAHDMMLQQAYKNSRKRRGKKKTKSDSSSNDATDGGSTHSSTEGETGSKASISMSQGSTERTNTPGDTASMDFDHSFASTPAGAPQAKYKIQTSSGSEWFDDCATPYCFAVGDHVIVDGDRGVDLGVIQEISFSEESHQTISPMTLSPALPPQIPPRPDTPSSCSSVSKGDRPQAQRRVRRKASAREVEFFATTLVKEQLASSKVVSHIAEKVYGGKMKIVRVYYQFDKKKMTIVYSGPQSLHFPPLLNQLNSKFRCRIWMELDRSETDETI